MKLKDPMGERIKEFEQVASGKLMPRMPVIIRVDGKSFHTVLRKAEKPYDNKVQAAMQAVACALLSNIQGAKLAYHQSDECSVLLTDWDRYETQSWFDYKIQKLASLSASIATAAFNKAYPERDHSFFDGRCFNLPRHEVNNYFIWRQRDAIRNSVNVYGQTYLNKASLKGQNTISVKTRLKVEANIIWEDSPAWHKQGQVVCKLPVSQEQEQDLAQVDKFSYMDELNFSTDPNFIERFMTEPFWKEKTKTK